MNERCASYSMFYVGSFPSLFPSDGGILEHISVSRHVRYGVIVCGLLQDSSIPHLNQGKEGKGKDKKEKKERCVCVCVWESRIPVWRN